MRFRVLPYRQGSRSARNVAHGLGGRVLRLNGSTFVPRNDDVLINWGNTNGFPFPLPRAVGIVTCTVLNHPEDIHEVTNKRSFFERMAENDCADVVPMFWTNRDDIPDDAFPVLARTVLAGHSGDGIVFCRSRVDLVPAPLYVKYIKKQDEYRVHVGANQTQDDTSIISVQRKARRHDHDNPNWQIRNHQNGFIYQRNEVNAPDCVIAAARRALLASGIDFGAVDVIYNARYNTPYVLEINTAPGLEGTTVDDYVRYFQTIAN